MFDIGKKGAEKAQDSAARDDASSRTGSAESVAAAKRAPTPGGHREPAAIGASIQIDGDLRGEEDLIIEGEVNGTVQLKNNTVTIGTQGRIRADVYAHSIYVDGYVEGDLYGSERVSIRKTAQVRGNITSPRVSLDDGARFKGSIEMDSQTAASDGRRSAQNAPTSLDTAKANSGSLKATGDGAAAKPEVASAAKKG